MTKKMLAEFIGTFTLVLFGCGSAVLAGADHVGQLGIAFAKPTVSRSVSTASWMRSRSFWTNGLYLPPSNPGRIGRTSSASGAARSARRASRPPDRRDRASAAGSCAGP